MQGNLGARVVGIKAGVVMQYLALRRSGRSASGSYRQN